MTMDVVTTHLGVVAMDASSSKQPRGVAIYRQARDSTGLLTAYVSEASANRRTLHAETQRFKEPLSAEDQSCARSRERPVSSTFEWPEKWTPAHATKAACANQLPAWLSAKKTATFGSTRGTLGRRPFRGDLDGCQGQFQGQSRGQSTGAQVAISFILSFPAAVRWPRG